MLTLMRDNLRLTLEGASSAFLEALDWHTSYDHEGMDGLPDPRFNQVDREQTWDGKIHLLHLPQRANPWVPAGLDFVVKWVAQQCGLPFLGRDLRQTPEPDPEFSARYPTPIPLFDYQEVAATELCAHLDGVAEMPPRCFAPSTELVTFEGWRLTVGDLKVGDRLPGPNGKPRTVLSIHRGEGTLYALQRAYADPIIVNGGHLLPLRYGERKQDGGQRTTRWVDRIVPVEEWCAWSDVRKRKTRLSRAPLVFGGDCGVYEEGERFAIERAGFGPFIGFELDGDRLFVMPDGTIQHNSGKSRTLFEVVRRLALPTIWVAPRTSIVDQTVAAAREWFEDFDALEVKSANQKDVGDALLTVCTAATAGKLTQEFWNTRQVLVCDELHHFLAQRGWGKEINSKSPHIAHRKGMTGTFFRSAGDNLALYAFLSQVRSTITSTELEARGRLVPCYSTFVRVEGPQVRRPSGAPKMFNGPAGHGTLGLVKHEVRCEMVSYVARKLASLGRTVLVLVWTKPQGEKLLEMLRPHFPGPSPQARVQSVEFVSTNSTKGRNREVLESFRKHTVVRILLGTSMVGEGTDLPPADALVYAAGGKASVTLLQAWYRVITKTDSKQYAVVVDFADCHHAGLRKHSKARWRIMQTDPIFRMAYCEDLAAFDTWARNLVPWTTT